MGRIRYCRIQFGQQIIRRLKRAASLSFAHTETPLTPECRSLLSHVLHLREVPAYAVPAAVDGTPRLFPIVQAMLEQGVFTAEALQTTLAAMDEFPLLPSETSQFPLFVAAAQYARLDEVLASMLRDAEERAAVPRFVRRLPHSRHPLTLLDRSGLHSAGVAALLSLLRLTDSPTLSLVEQWLAQHGTHSEQIIQQALARQHRFAEELRKAEECFSAMSRMDWLPFCTEIDPLHRQLSSDPSGTYPRMSCQSQLDLRLKVEKLSKRIPLTPAEIVRHALRLSQEAETGTKETYVGFWLQTVSGTRRLFRSIPSLRARLYAILAMSENTAHYALLLFWGVLSGFAFLQARQPVFMLPFFALTAGCVWRSLFIRRKLPPLPATALEKIPGELRTLVIMPVVLHDSHDAIRQVRRLKMLSHAFPESGADFLLLGDFPESMTVAASGDAAIIQAVASAISALEDSRFLYLQRGRTWNGELHKCCARGGRRGAVTCICRLISQGECEDTIAYASLEPASLERRYAYILVLPPDSKPAPGMLEKLLETISHPLCSRYPAPDGWRGYAVMSPQGSTVFDGCGLIQPGAYLEATDGLLYDHMEAPVLCGELAGHASVTGAVQEPSMPEDSWEHQYRNILEAWQLAPWQLPWVQTPSGFIRNPLNHASRFRLRELLRNSFVPLGQLGLMLWAVASGSWPLLLLSLIAPELHHIPRRISDWLAVLRRLALLPMRAVLPFRAIIDLLRKKPDLPSFAILEVWVQGIAATLMTALGIAFSPLSVPALLLGALFACFYPVHKYLDTPLRQEEGLTEEQTVLLTSLAKQTWNFFLDSCAEENRCLPPCSVQFEPPVGAEPATTPEAIAAALLSCVCARELGLTTANEVAARIRQMVSSLAELSMPFGLPCRRYALPSLTVQDPRVEAAGVGILLAALLTAAQALRTWLPNLAPEYQELSAEVDKVADSFDISALYDARADLFHRMLDENGQGVGYVHCFTDEALLLSVAAGARRLIPYRHFARLSRVCVRLRGRDVPLSRTGTALSHLLPDLFFPVDETAASDYISAMQANGHDGLWGQSSSRYFRFDPALRYLTGHFGLQEAALTVVSGTNVFSPHAAALCLPHVPHAAADALLRFHELGAAGTLGMCDAIDCTQRDALVGMYDTLHQGIMLMSIAHILADAPVQRFFCGLPEVEACLPLLRAAAPPLVLPILPALNPAASSIADVPHQAQSNTVPAEAHLIGTYDFHLWTDSRCNSALFDQDIPLTQFDARSQLPQGIQFYLADEGRVYRIGDPHHPGQVLFAPGETRFEQLCGSLKAELVCTVDTVHRRMIHTLTITNLSTRDRVIDAADCLLPDLNVPQNTLEVHREHRQHLILCARGTHRELHHTLNTSIPMLSLTVCTDAVAFLGRNRTLHAPASLEEPALDLLEPSPDPCLSFRVRLALGGRGQATIWLTTSLQAAEPPQLSALPGIRRLAALQHEAIAAAAPLDDGQCALLRRLLPLLMQARRRIVLRHPAAEDVLSLLAVLNRLQLHGMKTMLWIVCSSETQDALREELSCLPGWASVTLSEAEPPADWEDALLLRGDTPLTDQLDACYRLLSQAAAYRPPLPAQLPHAELEHRSTYGGFDPESGDYVIELEPGATTPAPWTNRHVSRHFQETVDESGFRSPFHEKVWIILPDGTALTPWSLELPRSIRMEAGLTRWETWSDKLDIRLSAACMPGHRCGMRTLRLRNATDTPLTVQLCVLSDNLAQPLDCVPGIVMAQKSAKAGYAYLAGEGWTSKRFFQQPTEHFIPEPDAADHPKADCAMLTCTLTLPPQGSSDAAWLSGFARHAEDTARALQVQEHNSPSALLRQVKAGWAQQLQALSVSTPEDTFDLLMNSILPRQFFPSECASGIAAMSWLSPAEAKRRLLRSARTFLDPDEWAALALLIAAFVQVTDDTSVLDVQLPQQEASLYDRCAKALLSLPLDHQGLPLGQQQSLRCMKFAAAAQALSSLRPNPALDEFSRKLRNAADIHLWKDSFYGAPLQLNVQCLASIAYGATPRTRLAMRTAWTTLYDPPHGLIRHQEATDAPPLPGLPANGGMRTADAAICIHALLQNGMSSEAHELLRALNPIHHADDPSRMETFRCAPYHLHGGMCAAPMEAGRAIGNGGDEAAALLYTIVLHDVLGLRRKGNTIQIVPCVPPDWDDYAFTLRQGASTWHINVERYIRTLTIDGDETQDDAFTLYDDGRVHQVRVPLK